MPAFAALRQFPSSDPTSETIVAVTPRKTRLRSDSDAAIGSPLRKSPRLCKEGTPHSSPTASIRKCLKTSLNLSGSPQKKQLSEDFVERQNWNPRVDETQRRAANEALHVSTAQMNVVCRENEQNRILDFCKKCIKEEKAGSLYVCGCPGTGKTLSMEKVKVMLADWENEECIQYPDVLPINCTSLANMNDIFSKIIEKNHSGKKRSRSTSSLQQLQNLYSQQTPGMKMILVIADELDYLITRDRAVLHDLFMLTTLPFSKCILLGVANAIDLADRFIPKLRSLNCKPMVITFCAYSKDQIINILQERLRAVPYTVFQPQALELCARKVAAASGDMRKALAVCRSAIEILIGDSMLSSLDGPEDQHKPAENVSMSNQVRIDHVAAALSKVYKSPVVDTIISLPQHQQIILCSAVKLFRGGKKKDTTLGELNKYYVDVCKSTSIPPVGILELSSMCRVLDDQGILKLGQSRDDKLRRVTLKVDGADIVFALQGVRFFRNCLQ
ncbi:cell division control protein 6 homolog B-like isoform X1 [Salvia splendens]|uniref:cell division control protein 6 homolog B-like isoform X1 n=1 Tax=Salvia splendens TaxID=180675 RepID=UPI001C265F1A|nr:cell division control protein 6 homolog B-like isoform X1 [Salvia splendens]XP_042013114.1 cell division control protein 6 homolog B-like isoform X1 [Salvia splendens]